MWFSMSTMDYDAASTDDGRKTAAWYVLGMPLNLVFAACSTMSFSMVARRGRKVIAWLAMFAVFGSLIYFAYIRSTSQARLAQTQGVEIPAGTSILRLREAETFGDGAKIWGACTADRDLVEAIIARHSLAKDLDLTGGYFFSQYMPEANIPEDAFGFSNGRLTCYFNADTGRFYFIRFPPSRR